MSRRLTMVLAIGCGASVGNLYYAQPLLHSIAAIFHATPSAAGLVVTGTQAGYALGLLFLVPIGDLVDRRKLVLRVLAVLPLALLAAGLAPSLGFMAAACLAVGLASVVAQVMVPFAADLAADEERGKVVGTVMSGLLTGILLARTVSGLVAGVAGWRAMYFLAAAAMVLLLLVLRHELPEDMPKARISYGKTLVSVGRLLRDERIVRTRSLYGALGFAAFSAFWTTSAFVLSAPPYNYSDSVIGLFGLIGAAGATAASLAGRAADRGWVRPATGLLAAALTGSFALLRAGDHHIVPLILGIIILDVAAQGLGVLNQSEIYGRVATARSTATSAYMTCYFLGGALGSAAGALLYQSAGWAGVCWLGGGIGGMALLLWLGEYFRKG